MQPSQYEPTTRYAFHHDGRLFCEGDGWSAVMRIWPEQWIEVNHHGGHWAESWYMNTAPSALGSRVLSLAQRMAYQSEFPWELIVEPEETPQLPLPGFIKHVGRRYHPSLEMFDDAFIYRDHLRCFLETLPPHLQEALRYSHFDLWQLLQTFVHCPRAIGFSKANPMLFRFLLDHYLRGPQRERLPFVEMNDWMERKQIDILDFLGLPASESNRRILARVSSETSTHDLRPCALKHLQTFPKIHRIVEHLPVINEGLCIILGRDQYYSHLTGSLLTEISQLSNEEAMELINFHFYDAIDLLQRAGMTRRKMYSVKSLKRIHDELLTRLGPERLMNEWERKHVFPAPPYAGTENIVPITTPEELFREGVEQRHCVAIYAGHIARHKTYVYRILEPVRATMAIQRNDDGVWEFYQMQRKCNVSLRQACVRRVDDAWQYGHPLWR